MERSTRRVLLTELSDDIRHQLFDTGHFWVGNDILGGYDLVDGFLHAEYVYIIAYDVNTNGRDGDAAREDRSPAAT
jgi:hypothetical protein